VAEELRAMRRQLGQELKAVTATAIVGPAALQRRALRGIPRDTGRHHANEEQHRRPRAPPLPQSRRDTRAVPARRAPRPSQRRERLGDKGARSIAVDGGGGKIIKEPDVQSDLTGLSDSYAG